MMNSTGLDSLFSDALGNLVCASDVLRFSIQLPTFCGIRIENADRMQNSPLKNDNFLLKNGRLCCNSRYLKGNRRLISTQVNSNLVLDTMMHAAFNLIHLNDKIQRRRGASAATRLSAGRTRTARAACCQPTQAHTESSPRSSPQSSFKNLSKLSSPCLIAA